MDKLAALFQIPANDLLDDYNRFLYYGQGKLIREHRQSLRLGIRPYARYMKTFSTNILAWESGEKRVLKKSWEKYFKDVLPLQ